MTEKRVSIVVPVYRAEKYLKRCVDSLRNQTYKNIEIVLVDDGSPDSCPQLCDGYAAEDDRIRVVHKQNGGLISAWQAGVRACSGDYLCFVDSDDWVETDMLQDMVSRLSETEEDSREIVCCNFVINRPGRETAHYHALAPGVYEGGVLQGEIKDNLLGHENRRISMSRCMKLFSRSLIEDNMQYTNLQIRMGEDVNITLPALLDCRRVVIMEDALYYHYFYNEESMVHRYDAGMYEGIRLLYRTIQEIYRIKGRKSGQRQADREYIYLLLIALKNEIRSGTAGYQERVTAIGKEPENRRLVREQPAELHDKTNRLLYLVLKHPGRLTISAVRVIFAVYDRMHGG